MKTYDGATNAVIKSSGVLKMQQKLERNPLKMGLFSAVLIAFVAVFITGSNAGEFEIPGMQARAARAIMSIFIRI
jgi:cell division protein FtsB